MVCIITRSPLASLVFKGLAIKSVTVKWTIKSAKPFVPNVVWQTLFASANKVGIMHTRPLAEKKMRDSVQAVTFTVLRGS